MKFPVASNYSCNHKKNRFRVKTPPPLLVLTYNFATTLSETTTINLKTLTTELQLVSKPQNCELKQEPRTLATALHQPRTLEYYLFSEKGFLLLAIMKDTKGSDYIYRYN